MISSVSRSSIDDDCLFRKTDMMVKRYDFSITAIRCNENLILFQFEKK
jgi:hypothetical protein